MQAGYYERNGAAREVLHVAEIETPKPGPGEVRIRLATSGINPSDVKTRAGTSRTIAFPRVIPHSDGAGEIDMVGDGVPASRVGERVWTWNAAWKRPFGTAAEYIVLPQAQAVTLPANASFEAGACLGIPAMTAHHSVAIAEIEPGTTVLVAGGAGAVGHYCIQFAKQLGATVISTVSSAEKAALATDAGADHIIDYKREDVGERVKALTGNRGIDRVIEVDFAANAKLLPSILHHRSQVVIYGTGRHAELAAFFCLTHAVTLRFVFVYELTPAERAAAIAAINRGLADGSLKNNVAKSFPLADIVAAHEAVEQGNIAGNVLLTLR